MLLQPAQRIWFPLTVDSFYRFRFDPGGTLMTEHQRTMVMNRWHRWAEEAPGRDASMYQLIHFLQVFRFPWLKDDVGGRLRYTPHKEPIILEHHEPDPAYDNRTPRRFCTIWVAVTPAGRHRRACIYIRRFVDSWQGPARNSHSTESLMLPSADDRPEDKVFQRLTANREHPEQNVRFRNGRKLNLEHKAYVRRRLNRALEQVFRDELTVQERGVFERYLGRFRFSPTGGG